MELIGLNTQRYDIGRATIWRRPVWDGTDDLFDGMVHIGNTEGAIDIAPNPEYSELTLPESSGPASLKRFVAGERPEFEIGIFPSPVGLAVFSPTARAAAGQQRRRIAREHTLWIVPEALFLKADINGVMTEVPVTYSGGVFLKDGLALTAAEQELVDLSIVIWRADFSRTTPVYRHEDGGKSLRSVNVRIQQDFRRPSGAQLYLVMGELADFPSLVIAPSSALGAGGFQLTLLGASYSDDTGATIIEARHQKPADFVMGFFPDTADFTFHSGAVVSRRIQEVTAGLPTDHLPYLRAGVPNFTDIGGGQELANAFYDGETLNSILVKNLALAAGVRADYVTAGVTDGFILTRYQTPFPMAGWDAIKDGINAANTAGAMVDSGAGPVFHPASDFCDYCIDLSTVDGAMDSTGVDGETTDRTLYESIGNKNHMSHAGSYIVASRIARAIKVLAPGTPLLLPDGVEVEAEDSARPAEIFVRAGERSVVTKVHATLGGVRMDGTTLRLHRLGVGSEGDEFDHAAVAAQMYGPAISGRREYITDLTFATPRDGDKFTTYGQNGAFNLRIPYGLTENTLTPVTPDASGNVNLDEPWVADILTLLNVDANNVGSLDERRLRYLFAVAHIESILAGADVTGWRDVRGAGLGMPVFAASGPAISYADSVHNGETVRTFSIPAGAVLATPASALTPIGANCRIKAFADFSADIGGSIVHRNVAGTKLIEVKGVDANIHARCVGFGIASGAYVDLGVTRVAAGSSLREVYMEVDSPNFTAWRAGIRGQGVEDFRGGYVDPAGATFEDGYFEFIGPIDVTLFLWTNFIITDAQFNAGRPNVPVTETAWTTASGVRPYRFPVNIGA